MSLGEDCQADRVWAAHLAWWLLAVSALLLAALAVEGIVCVRRGTRVRLAAPIFAAVGLAAVVFTVLFFAADSYNEVCANPGKSYSF